VVDNNSVDGSGSMIREKFPWAHLIENQENVGFSKANNMALKKAKGEFCLLLNPDTIVEENTFIRCVDFMRKNENAGALGVHMIDGKGKFLPESKRALPTPSVSFYKVFGLSALFPRSRIFGKYHLGYLPENKVNEVDILSGAFMFIRRKALEKTGYLDEAFFMYGEDIDLSYRIQNAGYQNFYFPETTIIHYKGESTKKGRINYVMVFYRAMIIFARKHFSPKNARLFSLLINLAIYFRAFLSILKRFISKVYQPLLDFIFIYAGFYVLTPLWERIHFDTENYFPLEYFRIVVPSYILIWLLSLYYSGGYEKPLRVVNLIKGHLTGTLIILILYALMPESFRYSRALILLGSIWALFALFVHRLSLNFAGFKDYEFYGTRRKRLVLVGRESEVKRVGDILHRIRERTEIAGNVSPDENPDSFYLGSIRQLREIIRILKVDEIIFCSQDIDAGEIIKNMTLLSEEKIDYKIAPPESISIIGSNSIKTAGDLYLVHFNSVSKGKNRRLKRLFDLFASGVIILLSPFMLFFVRKYSFLFYSSFKVIFGKYTWISYCRSTDTQSLPFLKRGIFELCSHEMLPEDIPFMEKMNLEYARDYRISYD
ncbi:MAG: glycosyltransferase, partial [Bacteroidales bacterium]|nr:glycosyltransferase [Bacteroidales bacterium]